MVNDFKLNCLAIKEKFKFIQQRLRLPTIYFFQTSENKEIEGKFLADDLIIGNKVI